MGLLLLKCQGFTFILRNENNWWQGLCVGQYGRSQNYNWLWKFQSIYAVAVDDEVKFKKLKNNIYEYAVCSRVYILRYMYSNLSELQQFFWITFYVDFPGYFVWIADSSSLWAGHAIQRRYQLSRGTHRFWWIWYQRVVQRIPEGLYLNIQQ